MTCRFVNALAFAPEFLPCLWQWLAHNIGMPLEAPQGATRGWDIQSLSKGFQGLQADHAAAFGVFCWYVARLPMLCTYGLYLLLIDF